MDTALRNRLKYQLYEYTKIDWLDPNKPLDVLEYIEANVTSLSNIWRSIETTMPTIRGEAAKDVVRSLHAYVEGKFRLEQLQREDKSGQEGEMMKVLQLADEAILHCPHHQTSQLARLFAFRSKVLFAIGQPDLALVAIKRALSLMPSLPIYDALATRYLIHLDRPQEALLHIRRAIAVSEHPPGSMANMAAGERISLDQLRELHTQTEQLVAAGNTLRSNVASDTFEAYETPHSPMQKNFSIDYRCEIHGQADVGKGRYFVATRPIKADTPLVKERTYSMLVLPEALYQRCHYCARTVTNRFWPCVGCTQTVYCAPSCAHLDWSRSHRFDCKLTKYWSDQSKSTGHVFRLLNRVGVKTVLELIGQTKEAAEVEVEETSDQVPEGYDLYVYSKDDRLRYTLNGDELDRQQYRAQMSLLSHTDKYTSDYVYTAISNAIECAVMACIVQGFEFEDISREQLLDLISHCFVSIRRVLTNAYRWSAHNEAGERSHITTNYMLVTAMFNHSCTPNAEWTIGPGCLTINAVRDIAAGEEITVSYGPQKSLEHFESRQGRLLEGYFFQCNCSACVEDARRVLTLQCAACYGPVLPSANSPDSTCLVCLEPYPNARDKLLLLKRARAEVTIKTQLLHFQSSDRQAHLTSLRQSLEQVLALSCTSSCPLIESIYLACKVFRAEGLLADCLHFGAIVDGFMLPPKAEEEDPAEALCVIADPQTAKEPSGPTSKDYSTPAALDANLEHLSFWCSVYQTAIERTGCVEEKTWREMSRFYKRLRLLLESMIEAKRQLVEEQDPAAKETFETVGQREEIDFLCSFKTHKEEELQRLKDKFAGQLAFQLEEAPAV